MRRTLKPTLFILFDAPLPGPFPISQFSLPLGLSTTNARASSRTHSNLQIALSGFGVMYCSEQPRLEPLGGPARGLRGQIMGQLLHSGSACAPGIQPAHALCKHREPYLADEVGVPLQFERASQASLPPRNLLKYESVQRRLVVTHIIRIAHTRGQERNRRAGKGMKDNTTGRTPQIVSSLEHFRHVRGNGETDASAWVEGVPQREQASKHMACPDGKVEGLKPAQRRAITVFDYRLAGPVQGLLVYHVAGPGAGLNPMLSIQNWSTRAPPGLGG